MGEPVTLDVPGSVRRSMPVRHFTLASIEGRDALLRAGRPVGPVTLGAPVVMTVGRAEMTVEGTVMASSPPDGLALRLAATLDRRFYPRVPIVVEIELEQIDGSDTPIRAVTVDLSEGGALVRCSDPFPPGGRAFVGIPGPWGSPVMAIGQVVSCAIAPGEHLYRMRLEFTSLGDEQRRHLHDWLAETQTAGTTLT